MESSAVGYWYVDTRHSLNCIHTAHVYYAGYEVDYGSNGVGVNMNESMGRGEEEGDEKKNTDFLSPLSSHLPLPQKYFLMSFFLT